MNTEKLKILVPFDFSELSLNAYRFAMKMMPDRPKEIIALHIYSGFLDQGTNALIGLGQSIEEQTHTAMVEYFGARIDEGFPSSHDLTHLSIEGSPVQEIVKYAKENNIDYVVMGTRSHYPSIDRILGTISLGVAKTSNTPVYIIPENYPYSNPRSALIAIDKSNLNETKIRFIKKWNRDNSANLHFLHLEKDNPENESKSTKMIVSELFENDEISQSFEILAEKRQDIANGILEKAIQLKADLIMLFPEHQSFISALLFKSTSKSLILSSAIPLLFVPEEVGEGA